MWREIADGVTAQTTKSRVKYWGHCKEYCRPFKVNPYLENLTACERTVVLTGFSARVWIRDYCIGDQVSVQTVTNALADISKICQLVGKQSPIIEAEGKYILPLKHIVKSFRRLDLPSIPQMYIPVEVPEEAIKLGYLTPNARKCATAHLTNIAFYYILRSRIKVKRNG